jgi:hypothetical protein
MAKRAVDDHGATVLLTPRNHDVLDCALADARSALSMYQVHCPITATSRFVEPSRRRSMSFLIKMHLPCKLAISPRSDRRARARP